MSTGLVTYRPEALATAPQPAPPAQGTELAEWAQAAQAAYGVAEIIVQTPFVPAAFRGKAYDATAAILAGSEVGLSPMASLRAFDVIQGAAAPRAMTLRAIVQSKGHEVWVEERTDSRAIVCGRRKNSQHVERSVWTIDRARSLKLTGKDNWQNQPQAMLVARATAEVCRLVAADAILGMPYSVEEYDDGAVPADLDGAPAPEQRAAPVRTARRATKKAATPPAAVAQPQPTPAEAPPLPGEDGYEDQAEAESAPTVAQNRKMHALFRESEVSDRDERLRLTSKILDREITTSAALTRTEASALIDQMEQWSRDGHLADHAHAVLHGDETE